MPALPSSRASRRAVMTAAVALGATFLMNSHALAAPAVGQPAPDFVGVDTAGKQHRLSDFAGKFVVLEWTNPGCPFVRKHYGSGNMPATQKAATAKGVVWLSINSTERAASDYLKPPALDAWMKDAVRRPHRRADGRGRRHRPNLRRAHHARTSSSSTPRARWSTPAASTAFPRRAPTTSRPPPTT